MNIKSKIKNSIRNNMLRLLPGYVYFDQNRNDRSGALFKAWGMVISNQMSGGYYEFGVYQGESFRESFRIYQNYAKWGKSQAKSHESWRRQVKWEFEHQFYGFDTFEGMPDNVENNPTFTKGTFLCSLDEVKKLGEEAGMFEEERVRYFKGLFSDIEKVKANELKQLLPAVIVNIDSDLYSSAKDALNIVQDKFQQGTILLLDDFNAFRADRRKGERRALNEFLEINRNIEVESWFPYSHAGQAFIVHLQ